MQSPAMTYYDILDGAIATVCEDVSASHLTEDYISRGQFILAGFVAKYASLDATWREMHDMEAKAINTNLASVNPRDEFPFCDVFAPVAVNYLASGLVIDENEEMSDKFFDRYITGIMDIRNALPAKQAPIVDRYGLD